jgi:hypothetical protein
LLGVVVVVVLQATVRLVVVAPGVSFSIQIEL